MSKTGWATLLQVNSRLEAEILKEALEAQGIPAAIFQEGAMHYVYPVAIGPLASVELCVPKERLGEAQAWLADYESGALEEPPGEDNDEIENDEA
jgi:hypothetical protein